MLKKKCFCLKKGWGSREKRHHNIAVEDMLNLFGGFKVEQLFEPPRQLRVEACENSPQEATSCTPPFFCGFGKNACS